MKKIIALVLCLFIFLPLAACSGGDSGAGFAGVDHSGSQNKQDIQNSIQKKAEFSKDQAVKSREISAGFVKAMTSIDNGETEEINWPASDFPEGYPVYPGGEIVYSEYFFDKDLMIFITETNKSAYDSYIETLKTAGWIFVEIDGAEDEGEYAVKGSWSITVSYYEDYGVGMYISDTGFDVESLYMDYEWPENLPGIIPVYTDGKISFVVGDDDMLVYSIAVTNSSKTEFENYTDKLAGLGWALEDDGDFILAGEDGSWHLSAEYDADNTLFITVFYMEKYDFGLSDEELALLENNRDNLSAAEWPDNEFTKLIPEPDFELFSEGADANKFTAVFYNITVPMIKDYAEKVKTAGFTLDSSTSETDTTYTYTASNGQGYTVSLKLFSGETLYITLEK